MNPGDQIKAMMVAAQAKKQAEREANKNKVGTWEWMTETGRQAEQRKSEEQAAAAVADAAAARDKAAADAAEASIRAEIANYSSGAYVPDEQSVVNTYTATIPRQYNDRAAAIAAQASGSGVMRTGFYDRNQRENRLNQADATAQATQDAKKKRQDALAAARAQGDTMLRSINEAGENKLAVAQGYEEDLKARKEAMKNSQGWLG